jgi:hypothetical protein
MLAATGRVRHKERPHGASEARDPVNRRIALALILTLLAQSFLPAIGVALEAGARSGTTLLICTGEGIKEIALDPEGSKPAPDERQPRAQPCCPCAVPCQGCVPVCADRVGMRIVYGLAAAFRPQPEAVPPISARAPPAHRSRAPPVLS